MGNLDNFKNFVKNNPHLITYVNNGSYTWQKFYEMYDLYGEKHDIWNNFIKKEEVKEKAHEEKKKPWDDFINMAKNIDVDKIQSGISSLEKALALVGDIFVSKDSNKTPSKEEYKPRPIFRRFED